MIACVLWVSTERCHMYRFKQLIGKWLLLSTLLGLSSWANARTVCIADESTSHGWWIVVNKGTASSFSGVPGIQALINTSANANDLGNFTIHLVIPMTVIATDSGDSCFIGMHQGNQSMDIGNLRITMSSPVVSGCGVRIGNQDGNRTYKGGANFQSPWGLATDLWEAWGCTSVRMVMTQEMKLSVIDPKKPMVSAGSPEGFRIEGSSFAKVSAGQRSADLNGEVWTPRTMSFRVEGPTFATCSLNIPPNVSLNNLSGISETAQGLMKKSQIDIPVSLANCSNLSGRTQTPTVTLTDANNVALSCTMINTAPANAKSRGVVSLFLDSSLTKQVCFGSNNNKLVFSSLANGQQGFSETKNISAVIDVPAQDKASPRTVSGQIRSSVVLVTTYP